MRLKLREKFVTRAFVLLIMVFIVPSFAWAFPPGGVNPERGPDMGPGIEKHHMSPYGLWRNPELIQGLELTDEQIAQLKKADFTFREKNLNLKAQLDNLNLQMEKAFSTEPVDEAAVLQMAKEISDLRGKMFVQDIESRLACEKLLTADQLKKLKAGFSQRYPIERRDPHRTGRFMEQEDGRQMDKNRERPIDNTNR
jgi:Spy/CpxP family protein refolding chaperone